MKKQQTCFPGIDNKPFLLRFEKDWLHKGEVIQAQVEGTNPPLLMVTKVYNRVWWRWILHQLGFKTKLFGCVLVKELKDDNKD